MVSFCDLKLLNNKSISYIFDELEYYAVIKETVARPRVYEREMKIKRLCNILRFFAAVKMIISDAKILSYFCSKT